MSDFKKSLEEEINQSRTEDKNSATASDVKNNITSTSRFSFSSLIMVMFFGILLTSLLVVWANKKTPEIYQAMLDKMPSKTAIIDLTDRNGQTTISIPQLDAQEIENPPIVAMKDPTPPVITPELMVEEKTAQIEETTKPAAVAPPSIVEKTAYGLLPQIDTSINAKPFKIYQSGFKKQTNKPLLSFIVTDLGLSQKTTADVIKNLPAAVTLSFSPYAHKLENTVEIARGDGHEIWLDLPLETKEYPLNDPGPSTLLVNAATEKNKIRLHTVLGRATGYVGFISPAEHVFKTEDAAVNPAIKEIFDRGLAVIDGNMSMRSFIQGISDKNDYPYAQNSLWLDGDLASQSIVQNIKKISNFAAQNQNVIVMLHPYPASIKALQSFLESPAANEFELAPASAQLKNNN